jgi:hypothetical protein
MRAFCLTAPTYHQKAGNVSCNICTFTGKRVYVSANPFRELSRSQLWTTAAVSSSLLTITMYMPCPYTHR